jgi:hypothetical protein
MQVGEWDLQEYVALLLVIEVVLMSVYGVISSFFDKVLNIRRTRLSILEHKSKEGAESAAERSRS